MQRKMICLNILPGYSGGGDHCHAAGRPGHHPRQGVLFPSVAVLHPGIGPGAAGNISGAATGLAYTFVRKLGARGENSLRIVFFFSLFSTLLTLPFFVQLADIFLLLAVNGGGGQDAEIWIPQIPHNQFATRSCHTHCMKEQHGRIPPVAICLKQH